MNNDNKNLGQNRELLGLTIEFNFLPRSNISVNNIEKGREVEIKESPGIHHAEFVLC